MNPKLFILIPILFLAVTAKGECTNVKRVYIPPQFYWHDWMSINNYAASGMLATDGSGNTYVLSPPPNPAGFVPVGWSTPAGQSPPIVARCVDVTVTNVSNTPQDINIVATAAGPLFGSASAVNPGVTLNYQAAGTGSTPQSVSNTSSPTFTVSISALASGQSSLAAFCGRYIAPTTLASCKQPNCVGDWHMFGAFDFQVQICEDKGAVTAVMHSRQELETIIPDTGSWAPMEMATRNAQMYLPWNGGRPF